MSSTKHLKSGPKNRPRDDLEDNPQIGGDKGSFASGMDPKEIQGENTVEGDVENDATPQGGVNPNQTVHKDKRH